MLNDFDRALSISGILAKTLLSEKLKRVPKSNSYLPGLLSDLLLQEVGKMLETRPHD
jgi:hypothetical protein